MSIVIPETLLTKEMKRYIATDLCFTPKETDYNRGAEQDSVYSFEFDEKKIYLPFNYAVNKLKLSRRDRNCYGKMSLPFSGDLRPLQKEVRKEVIKLLNKRGSCILSLFTGGGKTCTAINISTKIGLKTLVIVSRLILFNQWIDSVKKFCPNAKVQKITPKTKKDPDADFYIMNAINVPKLDREYFRDVGFLIVDEVHLIGTEKLSSSMFYVQPRYTLALSATPYRSDGMDQLLYSFFGSEKVFRKLHREHTVFKIKTGFVPEKEETKMGKLNWNTVLNSQAENEKRNKLIRNLVREFADRNFLILCKRVSQASTLVGMLEEAGVDVTSLVGMKREFRTEARALVATVQKAGVGFDHPKLDSLIIAADLQEYFIQYLGRVFRTQDGSPLIFDLVDNFSVLEKHWRVRRKVYLEHGGTVKKFETCYPDFPRD